MRLFAPLLLLACSSSTPPAPTAAAPAAPKPAPPPASEAGPEKSAVLAPQTAGSGPIELKGDTGPIQVTVVYHATTKIEAKGLVIWVDPWSKAALDGPKADILLLTDIHPDHLDPEAIEKVIGPNTTLVGPPAVAEQYKAHPVLPILKNGEKGEVKGVSIEAVAMYNLVRGPESGKLFHDKGRGDGYVLTLDGRRIYLAGDTECTPEMKALTGIDLALVPMNLPYTMPPEEAAACVAAFKPKQVTPYHYAGSDLTVFAKALATVPEVSVVERNAYPGGLPW